METFTEKTEGFFLIINFVRFSNAATADLVRMKFLRNLYTSGTIVVSYTMGQNSTLQEPTRISNRKCVTAL